MPDVLHFSPLLQRDRHASLRTRITDVADPCGAPSLVATTIYEAMAASPDDLTANRASVVLVDFSDVVWIRGGADVCPVCLAHHAFDGHLELERGDAERIREGTYRFQGDPAALDLLPYAVASDTDAVHVDADAFTVEPLVDVRHSECPSCRLHAGSTRVERAPDPIPVQDSLRQDRPVQVADLHSEYAGLVREEETRHDAVGFVGSISAVHRRPGRPDATPMQSFCGGSTADPDTARFVGRCEVLERAHVFYNPGADALVHAAYEDVRDRAVNPDDLFFHYGGGPFPTDAPVYWTPATNLLGGDERLVPAQHLWFQTRELEGESAHTAASTNGCALGTCVDEAVLHALFELVERDAVVTTWLLQRPCPRIDPDALDAPRIRHLLTMIRRAHPAYRVLLLDATNDLGLPVVWAVAVRSDDSDVLRTIHTSGGGATLADATWSALVELSNRFAANTTFAEKRETFEAAFDDPSRHTGLEHHWGVAGLDAAFERFRFLSLDAPDALPVADPSSRDAASPVPRGDAHDLRDVLDAVVDRLDARGLTPYAVDLTRTDARERGAACAKAIVPGLYPFTFGMIARPRHVTPRLRALHDTWFPDTEFHPNEHPHPFG